MRTKGNCTTKWQSGARRAEEAKAQRAVACDQPVPHAGHLYTMHDMDTSAAAGWLEARCWPDPARGRSDPSAWRGRCGGARGTEGGGGWRQNAEVGLWTRSGGATERPGSHHGSHESEMGLAMLSGRQRTSCFSADDPWPPAARGRLHAVISVCLVVSFLLKIRPSCVDADGHLRYSVGTDDLDKNIFVCTPSGSVYIHLNFHIQFPSVRRQQGIMHSFFWKNIIRDIFWKNNQPCWP